MDTGCLVAWQRTWIFTRPYFDVLPCGKKHTVSNARDWRIRFDKPYIGQESWMTAGRNTPTAIRPIACTCACALLWKLMMAKVPEVGHVRLLAGQ
jgi:hypothetical protein